MADNAVLERVLTEADPARTPRDARPDAAALLVRDRIIHGAHRPSPRRRSLYFTLGSLAVAAVAAVVAVCVILPPSEAVATTPKSLAFSDAGSVTETVETAQIALTDGSGPAAPERTVRSAYWAWNIDMDAGSATVVPSLATLHWEPDLSGRVTVIAGEAYDPADAVAHSRSEVSSSGEVVMDMPMKPGEFGTPVIDPPGSTPEELFTTLQAFGVPADPSAFEVMDGVDSILQQWTLTDQQHSSLLSILSQTDGMQALGVSTDRLGRAVAGIRVLSAHGNAADVMLLSLETGRIVGLERTNLVDDGVLAAGAVISYRLWDLEEGLIE